MSDVVLERLPGGVLLVRLNRPERLNAIGGSMAQEFADAMQLARTDVDVRAVVITGAGRAFCSGADLVQRSAAAAERREPSNLGGTEAINDLHDHWSGAAFRVPKPTIALVNGAAAGAGFGLALACDFRIAAESAIFVSAFARIGLTGDNGITWGLTRTVGRAKALEILMLNPRITAPEALGLGLVRQVVPDDDLYETGIEFADRLAAGPVEAFAIMKRNLEYAETADFEQSLRREAEGISVTRLMGENAEAIDAFLQKRDPEFRR
ncbi:enoyl-CoA hydratase [Planctomonas sp. JC2975]|uniref:enoyl-CoA hydratase-related protein n=1 Tax=Planctomonas sp. JC2975 TaxID=2729626 RepID=UPI0014750052|nr:enoyl-CoA hydratase-related protein [Planctomonas sp. JC2975]NNC13827.1 enoyl-CoA hydratase [Planctomonas sp. JC2975]